MMWTDRERYILLNMVPGIGPAQVKRLLEACGGLAAACGADASALRRLGVPPRLAERISAGCRDRRLLNDERERAGRAGAAIITPADEGYPERLRQIHDPPLALYVRGTLPGPGVPAVAIVGTRRASAYGLQAAERLAQDLALRGIWVVSGLARGIDGAAHRGALRGACAGGGTVGVLGHGFGRMYPPEHADLAQAVADRGAVCAEYPMGMPPRPEYFPRRNRIISGLSLGVVVVEAAARSGAIITADCALEQGREVFAVPGPMAAVTSQGPHALLKQGAALVTGAEDILDALGLAPGPAAGSAAGLTDEERRMLSALDVGEARHPDHIAALCGAAPAAAAAALTLLAVRGAALARPGGRFVRNAEWTSR
ncbi:MAG TPA: DNA-processing protein DprA [bacterium]